MTPEEYATQADAAYGNAMCGRSPVHPDLAVKIYKFFVADAIRAAVEEEREACAKLVENAPRRPLPHAELISLIRARGSVR